MNCTYIPAMPDGTFLKHCGCRKFRSAKRKLVKEVAYLPHDSWQAIYESGYRIYKIITRNDNEIHSIGECNKRGEIKVEIL